jgi:biotin transport system substrate-specific component
MCLGIAIGWDKPLIQLGVHPFLLAELFKILLLLVVLSKINKIKKYI